MVKTVDESGIVRDITRKIWGMMPVNKDGSKGQCKLRLIEDTPETSKVEDDIKKFIEEREKLKPVEKIIEPDLVEKTIAVLKEDDSIDGNEKKVVPVEKVIEPILKKVVKPRAKRTTKKK